MPLSLGPLSVACRWFLSAMQIWAEGETKIANGSISRDLSPSCTPTSAEHPPGLALGDPWGPPTPQNSGGKPGGTRTEVWDELHKLSRKQSQVFEEGVKAAEERGRKKSVSQQWRAESSSSRTQERR